MQNVKLGLRWVALPTAAFFIFALLTDTALGVASVALVIVCLAVIAVAVVDLLTRRRDRVT
jgi:hypothetical protein